MRPGSTSATGRELVSHNARNLPVGARGTAGRDSTNKGSPSTAVVVVVCGIDNHPDIPSCTDCGLCCHLVVELRTSDAVPEAYVVEHDGVRCMEQRGDGACVALDPVTRLCSIYETRPQTCRDFNRGGTLCRTTLARHGTRRSARAVVTGRA